MFLLKWRPHLHCIVSRGVWLAGGQWIPVPYIDTHAAEILFREKVFRLLFDPGGMFMKKVGS